MKIIYQASFWEGSTSLQRLHALQNLPGSTTIPLDTGARLGKGVTLWRRARWKLRWPEDQYNENDQLSAAVTAERPDAVIVDNSKVITRRTLRELRRNGVATLAYYTPDDIMGAHNLSWQLRLSLPEWDVLFTTKTFNVPELKRAGVRNPVLIGKAFDPGLHRPLSREEVGANFESYDLVFIGSCERQRQASINALSESGLRVVVYGGALGGWDPKAVHPALTLREACFGEAYTQAMHHGKIALCFLRKLNRDRITQRTMEIAASGRAMLAEKTDEHDAHFRDGFEYQGFINDVDLVERARFMLADETARRALGANARKRCIESGYSSLERARTMLTAISGKGRFAAAGGATGSAKFIASMNAESS